MYKQTFGAILETSGIIKLYSVEALSYTALIEDFANYFQPIPFKMIY